VNDKEGVTELGLRSAPTLGSTRAEGLARKPAVSQDISLVELVSVLIRHWQAVVGLPLLAALCALVYGYVASPTFTATTTFVPELGSQPRLPPGLSGLAGQLGVTVGSEASQSPRFYADVVRSREIVERVVMARYEDPRPQASRRDSLTLLEILNVDGRNPAQRLDNAVKALRRHLSLRVDPQTNIVSLSVDGRYPTLMASVANRLVEYLNDFNANRRQSQARFRRQFVEQRLKDAGHEVGLAEEQLKVFYERNRSWQQSPQLTFEEGRLRRQVQIQQEVYLTLSREFETARIQEVNDTPAITVIEPAVVPQERSAPRRVSLAVLALIVGTILGVSWAFVAEYLDRLRREGPVAYREIRDALREAKLRIRQGIRGKFGNE